MKKRILVICTGNSCRSQMAEGFLRSFVGESVEVRSAGTHPSFVHPIAIRVMKEIGIDISSHTSKSVDEFRDREFDYIITVCDNAREHCPVFPGKGKRMHIPFEDPGMFNGKEVQRLEKFRQVRDQIHASMENFLKNESLFVR